MQSHALRHYRTAMLRRPVWRSGAVAGLLAVAVAVNASTFPDGTPAPSSVPAPKAAIETGPARAPAAAPLQRPLELIEQARLVFQKVENYTCLMVKQERVQGRLEPNNLIEMKVRNRPFSVYMRWLGPREFKGQEVCFVAGSNKNMMRVHPSGLKGLAGFISISPDSPMVLEHSRHRINEAGVGNLIEQLAAAWKNEKAPEKLKVRIAEYEYNRRRCDRIEIERPEPDGNSADYRLIVYLDKQTHLPVRFERYDWPISGGPASGELLECYSYLDMRFNVAMPESTFAH